MEKYFQDQENLLKQTNDGRVQIRQLNLFKSLQSTLEQLDKKNLTQIQSRIETTLLNLIMSNRITSDILSRYICYIYIFIFDKGRNSHLTDFISNFCEIFMNFLLKFGFWFAALKFKGEICHIASRYKADKAKYCEWILGLRAEKIEQG